jgi:DNA-binding beta-propeller fold protein YncE
MARAPRHFDPVTKRTLRALAVLLSMTPACADPPAGGPTGATGGAAGALAEDAATAGAGGRGGASGGAMDGAGAAGQGGNPGSADAVLGGAGGSGMDAAGPVSADASPDRSPEPAGAERIVLVAGGTVDGDGIPAVQARLSQPFGAVVEAPTGDVYIAEYGSNRIRRIDGAGIIHTVVGPGAPGTAGNIRLDRPHDLLFRPGTRTLFIADTLGNRVLRMDTSTGAVEPFAGAGTGIAPGLRGAYCLDFDRAGSRLYVTNTSAGRIEVIDLASGSVTAINTPGPRVVTVDSKNNLYVVQNGGTVIKKIDPTGAVTNLPAAVNQPKRLTVDAEDHIVIADTEIDRIRKYVPGMGIVAVAGGAPGAGVLGGAPDRAGLDRPHGVFEDQKRWLYIADSGNNRVLRIER